LSEQFRNHTIQKTYHAIVVGKPKEASGSIKEQVNKISFFAEGFTNKTDEELLAEIKKATKTRTAELEYQVIKSNDKYSLLRILPKTGRFHQIRIQMQQMGCPILGDSKYPSTSFGSAQDRRSGQVGRAWQSRESIALSATAITFKTATHSAGSGQADDKTINLEIPLPPAWQNFI
jgi:23S rRNA-/tRNA-specific pseudouridylate synthase